MQKQVVYLFGNINTKDKTRTITENSVNFRTRFKPRKWCSNTYLTVLGATNASTSLTANLIVLGSGRIWHYMFCGHYGGNKGMLGIRHKVDVQLNTAPSHVEGIHWSLAQWNVASEIKIPAYRSALLLPLYLFTITTPWLLYVFLYKENSSPALFCSRVLFFVFLCFVCNAQDCG